MLSCVEIETISMQNDKTLNSPSVLILFNYSRNKNKNSSTKCTGLTRMTNSWAVSHKSFMVDVSPCALGFLPEQKTKGATQLALNMVFCSTPLLLNHRQSMHPQRTKINKIMLAAFPSLVFYTNLTISEFKTK